MNEREEENKHNKKKKRVCASVRSVRKRRGD